ncbi:helix-turn-helix domain-containing protein [Pseudomonas sp. NPDC007930]|uniref:AraC family transcriptional regulator n=1 Tax=Pseudomonas sp. NPDC007930 TaxID=3364417 RepID=UPI0036EDE468
MHPRSSFWRDPALPFIEARRVDDGRCHGHAAHSHETFSIGAVTAGRSSYLNLRQRHGIGAGTVVLMNPGDLHACNPVAGQGWAYVMLYLDVAWLRARQHEGGLPEGRGWQPLALTHSREPWLYQAVLGAFAALSGPALCSLGREERLTEWASAVQQRLQGFAVAPVRDDRRLRRAQEFIHAHSEQPLSLQRISEVAGLSPSQLVRSFKQRFGFTPHEFLVNRRVQVARLHLRSGASIASAAQAAGFADQAHLQRTFKRHLAATPGHYRNR